jgi:hypothetical protein
VGGAPHSPSLSLGMLSNRERAEGGLSAILLMTRFLHIISLISIPLILFSAIVNCDKFDVAFQITEVMLIFLLLHFFFWLMERLFHHLAS